MFGRVNLNQAMREKTEGESERGREESQESKKAKSQPKDIQKNQDTCTKMSGKRSLGKGRGVPELEKFRVGESVEEQKGASGTERAWRPTICFGMIINNTGSHLFWIFWVLTFTMQLFHILKIIFQGILKQLSGKPFNWARSSNLGAYINQPKAV